MRWIRSLMVLTMFVLPVCTTSVLYYIDIEPKCQNDAYQMNVNDTVVFQVSGFKKDTKTKSVQEIKITKVWWVFDKDILVKVGATSNSITLKAIKSGVSKIEAISAVENRNCTKVISILVK